MIFLFIIFRSFRLKTRIWYYLMRPQKKFESQKIIAVSDCTKHDLVETWHVPPEKFTLFIRA